MISFLIKRARRHWQVLSTVLFGVLVSTAFLASGPLIVNTVMEFALPHKLRASHDENWTIYLTTYNNQGSEVYRDHITDINNILEKNFSELYEVVNVIGTPWVFPWQEDSLISDERINFRYYGDIENRTEFISGVWPENPTQERDLIKAVIFEPMAEAYNIRVGDRLPMSRNDNEIKPSFWIEISGIIQPLDARDPYWIIDHNPFRTTTNTRYKAEFSVVLPENDFHFVTEVFFPNANLNLNWLAVIDPVLIETENINKIIKGIESTRANLSSFERRVTLETNLGEFLASYDSQAASVRPTLYLLIAEVLFLGLYYVVMVAALSIRQVEGELTTLTSRGASISQLFQIQIFEAMLICITAFIFGPIIAYGLVWSLARIGPISDVSQVDWLASLPTASWIAAGISVLACFTALLIPVIPILKNSVVQHRRNLARRTKKPWWHRYYIDVLLLVIGLAALWRLSLYGSISGTNGESIDWLLLLAPLALLIGSATVLLRLFPAIFRVLANLAARGRGLTAALVFWQTSRDPAHVTRLVLLFTLAMALGILSTGLNATLSLSEKERARYSTGGEARLMYDTFIPLSSFKSLPQVTSASAVWRGSGRANVRSYRHMPDFSLLAIDPLSFATVSQYRTDFTDDYIGFVLGQLIVDPEQLPVTTIPLTGQPTHFGIWVADPNPERTVVDLMEFLSIRAKIQSSEGEINTIDLDLIPVDEVFDDGFGPPSESDIGSEIEPNTLYYFLTLIFNMLSTNEESRSHLSPQSPTWRYFAAEIPNYADEGYPISLHSLWIKIRPMVSSPGVYQYSQGPLIIDDLSTKDSEGQYHVVEDFEQLTTIWQTDSSLSVASYTKQDISHSGEASMRLFLGAPGSSNWIVVSPAQATRLDLIPVLASPFFLELTSLKVGDKFVAHTNGVSLVLEIKNSVNYFPTMYETSDRGFLIISRDALLAELNRASRFPVNFNETWLRVDNTQDISSLLEMYPQATRTWEVETESKVYKSDPLTLGLRSVIFLGYSLTLLLSLVGFATYFYMSARQRGSIYGILRAFGFSTRQLYSSLVLEQLILILSGLAIGIFLGSVLNKIILPGLPISFGDIPPVPPFVPQEDWSSVIKLILIMLSGFFITLAIGTFLLWRAKLHQVLRVGEE